MGPTYNDLEAAVKLPQLRCMGSQRLYVLPSHRQAQPLQLPPVAIPVQWEQLSCCRGSPMPTSHPRDWTAASKNHTKTGHVGNLP